MVDPGQVVLVFQVGNGRIHGDGPASPDEEGRIFEELFALLGIVHCTDILVCLGIGEAAKGIKEILSNHILISFPHGTVKEAVGLGGDLAGVIVNSALA